MLDTSTFERFDGRKKDETRRTAEDVGEGSGVEVEHAMRPRERRMRDAPALDR